ncbi:DUF2785 domain-containing protein [Fictibacillus aquaticus]|uniref:DUF2785 domain-containing protein n=1 Tax=Fictibacillus aquaticus TaxID=2021314 RepID=A0A235F5T1_9BACL|nr:DUF2785 domain-containing protein [Fictibacillus aquaticus]OYD56578.1 hypothetical protein CGZ90_16330 [Fictibacillus aquaticus]
MTVLNTVLLKEKLENLDVKNIEQDEAFQLALEMMNHIGDTDPVLRDKLIYSTMFKMIRGKMFTENQLEQLLLLSVDESHLFNGLGEEGMDSVFTRTFSVLITALAVSIHNEHPFLSETVFHNVKEKVLSYARGENDIRGYVDEKGWAHSVAHMADCLDELAINHATTKADLTDILHIAQLKLMEPRKVFDTEEDERMVTAVCAVMKRGLHTREELLTWLESWSDYKKTEDYNQNYTLKINTKHFLRSLYFRLDGTYAVEREDIEKVLKLL